jgi:tRNA nucleotidyltransferase (CCA-adding enzyme)
MTLHEARSYLRQTLLEQVGREATAGEAAAHPFVSIAASAPVRAAAERLRNRRIDSLPLTQGRGEDRRFVGLVSRRDVDAALAHGLDERPVGELSLGPPPWIAPDRPLEEARRFLVSGASRLLLVGSPPVDAVGVLTRGTVLRALEEPTWSQGGSLPQPERLQRLLREGLDATWELVERLGEVAQALRMPLHVVGGTVRDLLLGLPVRDVDLVVEGDGPRVAQEAARRYGGTVRTHGTFGTATWRHEGQEVDLASARAEHYEALASLPRVELHAGLRQALFRRDFTLNAISISVGEDRGVMRDPFGGYADLQAGVLRVLHGLSFHDDPTRAFRAARFAARFDFRLSPETLGLLAAARKAGAFDRLGKERMGTELERIVGQREVVQAFRLLREWKLLQKVHPKFAAGREFVDRLGRIRDFHGRFAGLTGAGGSSPPLADVLWIEVGASIPKADRKEWGRMVPGGKERLRRFVWGAERASKAQLRLAKAQRPADAGWALEPLDRAELIYALATARVEAVRGWVEWWLLEGRKIRPEVDGDALIARGHRPGQELGRALAAAREAAWNGAGPDEQLAAAERVLSGAQ